MKLAIGSKINWVSAAGKLNGTISKIVLDQNAANHTVPWIIIDTDRGWVRLCGTDGNLKAMRVQLA